MATRNVNGGGRVKQVFEEYHARLRRYFFVQLGDALEAEACTGETIRRLFDFMEGRQWEREEDYINGYLMRIAFGICARRQAEQGAHGVDSRGEMGLRFCRFNGKTSTLTGFFSRPT